MPYEYAVAEILRSAKTLTVDKTRVLMVFQSSGIELDSNFNLVGFLDKPEACLNDLMGKLQYLPVVQVTARRIIRKQGLVIMPGK